MGHFKQNPNNGTIISSSLKCPKIQPFTTLCKGRNMKKWLRHYKVIQFRQNNRFSLGYSSSIMSAFYIAVTNVINYQPIKFIRTLGTSKAG